VSSRSCLTAPAPAARLSRSVSFEAKLADGSTQLTIGTGTKERLASLFLETPSPYFLRAARLEISDDGAQWSTLDQGIPIFREWGAEKLELALGGRAAAYVRVTLTDNRAAPLPFTGARILSEAGPAPEPVAVGARISARDEFAGETVLTVALDGLHSRWRPLGSRPRSPSSCAMSASASARRATRFRASARSVPARSNRVSLDGAPARAQLELPLAFTPSTRELLIHIYNGDSPPWRSTPFA